MKYLFTYVQLETSVMKYSSFTFYKLLHVERFTKRLCLPTCLHITLIINTVTYQPNMGSAGKAREKRGKSAGKAREKIPTSH